MLLFTVIVWGWAFVAIKICLEFVDPVELLGLRMVIAVPILALIIVLRKIKIDIRRAEIPRIAAISAVMMTHFVIQFIGLRYTTATNTGWMIGIIPLVIVVMSRVFLKEQIRARDMVGVFVATAGIIFLITRGDFSSLAVFSNVGDWLVLASTHTWAIYTILSRDIARAHHPIALTFILCCIIGGISLAYMAVRTDFSELLTYPPRFYVAFLMLAICATALGHWFWQEGLARIGAAKTGMFLYLEPLATTALAVPLLDEKFGIPGIIGGLLVLGGVYISQSKARNNRVTVKKAA